MMQKHIEQCDKIKLMLLIFGSGLNRMKFGVSKNYKNSLGKIIGEQISSKI